MTGVQTCALPICLQWSVLDWNEPSIAFYQSLGAVLMDEWTVCRLNGPALTALAEAVP